MLGGGVECGDSQKKDTDNSRRSKNKGCPNREHFDEIYLNCLKSFAYFGNLYL